jgi:hypothetical protein
MKFKEVKTIKEAGYYNPLDQERREQQAMDAQKRDFKRQEMQHELGHEDHPDFERNLRQQQMNKDRGPWYIRIDGVIYKQKGEPKVFDWKKGANNYALAMLKNNPSLQGKIMLSKNSADTTKESTELLENEDDSPMYGAIIHRIMVAHPDLLQKYGPEKIMMAAQEEAEWVGDVEEIGSSDVSISVKRVMQALQEQNPTASVDEGVDDEGSMAKSQLTNIAKKAQAMAMTMTPDKQLDAWVQSLISRAETDIGDVHDFLGNSTQHVDEAKENPEDVISVDIPLFIRLLEYAREDARTDMDLHDLTERLTKLCATGTTVSMDAYDQIVGAQKQLEAPAQQVEEATGHPGYDNMLKVLQAVDRGEDAHFDLAGEPITLEYPEARFLGGKYKAFLKAGRQEEFLKYMNDPVMFDRLMLQLRQLIDKQKNFKGSVPGERGVAEGLNFDDKKGRWEWDDGTRILPDELTPAQKQRVQKWKAANPGKRQGRATPDTRGEHTPHGTGAGPRVFEQGVSGGQGHEQYRVEMKDQNGKLQGIYHKDNKHYNLENMLSDIRGYQRNNPRHTFQFYINDKPVDWKELVAKQGVKEADESRHHFIRHNIWTVMDGDEEVMQHTVEGDPFFSAKKFMRDLDDEGYEFTHVVSPEGKVTYLPQFDPRNFPKDETDEAYSMDDVRKDAEANVKKNMDSESDARIASAKKPAGAPVAATLAGGLGLGLVAAAGAPAIVGILGPLLGIPFAAYGAYSAAKLGMKGVEKLWDMAAEKLGGDDKVEQFTKSKIAQLPPEEARAASAVVNKISESRKATKSLPQVNENEYYCNIDRVAKPIPEGYKKLASGYITRK